MFVGHGVFSETEFADGGVLTGSLLIKNNKENFLNKNFLSTSGHVHRPIKLFTFDFHINNMSTELAQAILKVLKVLLLGRATQKCATLTINSSG